MTDHAPHIWVISACYLCFVLTAPGKVVMKHGLLPHWYVSIQSKGRNWSSTFKGFRYYLNGILHLCLLIAFVPQTLFSLAGGWRDSVCCNYSLYSGLISGTVMFLFVFTKLLDLVETVLIILEGRQPLQIHIFHHVITLLFTWHKLRPSGRWSSCNTFDIPRNPVTNSSCSSVITRRHYVSGPHCL
uniref:Elongation of very long chain fatty acids protein n=1 Tax=Angiostrongylus cantonensis TaxID=6313 RepID=A0A0K0D094_ANGCA